MGLGAALRQHGDQLWRGQAVTGAQCVLGRWWPLVMGCGGGRNPGGGSMNGWLVMGFSRQNVDFDEVSSRDAVDEDLTRINDSQADKTCW